MVGTQYVLLHELCLAFSGASNKPSQPKEVRTLYQIL